VRILVFNAGSSSLKFGVFDMDGASIRHRLKATVDRLGRSSAELKLVIDGRESREDVDATALEAAVAAVPAILQRFDLGAIDAIGHRIAHGGERFAAPAIIDEPVIAAIDALTPLAPLHNPGGLAGIRQARATWPAKPQIAVFDTSFHLKNPPRATTYAVPAAWREAGLRRFGFHGTSHKYVALRAAEALGENLRDLRVISLHLGNGASACAIQLGESIDSSMGMTPLEGLVMGTRSGDVDPGIFGYLQRNLGLDAEAVEKALYEESGLKGLTGTADMRDVEEMAATGNAAAQLAIEIYAYRARKYVGAYAAAMGGLDALVFTGGIGENSAAMRRRICEGLSFLGLMLDTERNGHVDLTDHAAPQIQAYGSRVRVLVTETAEQLMIAREVSALLKAPAGSALTVPVAISARHVHLDQDAVDALFGIGYSLSPAGQLRQQGHWVARERLALEGPRGRLDNVAILGPLRARTQIEISRTDGFALGIAPPVRDSGKLDGTPVVRLIGPAGALDSDGLIIAARHIHTNPTDAARLGLMDGDEVDVRVGQGDRALTLSGTLVRVSPNAFTEMHIDTDEANAAGIEGQADGALVAVAATIRPSAPV
jgi:acetate kinase